MEYGVITMLEFKDVSFKYDIDDYYMPSSQSHQ